MQRRRAHYWTWVVLGTLALSFYVNAENFPPVQAPSDNEKTTESPASITPSLQFPVGTLLAYAGKISPEGFLIADGREISRKLYPQLFEVIGTSFGDGDGKNTFNLPNTKGRFLRGAENLSNNTIGYVKTNAFEGHFNRTYSKTTEGRQMNVSVNYIIKY